MALHCALAAVSLPYYDSNMSLYAIILTGVAEKITSENAKVCVRTLVGVT